MLMFPLVAQFQVLRPKQLSLLGDCELYRECYDCIVSSASSKTVVPGSSGRLSATVGG